MMLLSILRNRRLKVTAVTQECTPEPHHFVAQGPAFTSSDALHCNTISQSQAVVEVPELSTFCRKTTDIVINKTFIGSWSFE